MIDQTHVAREHLHQMVELANRLITESINQTDPVLDPERTISKEEFVEKYKYHSNELCGILDNMHEPEDVPTIDHEVEKSRKDLVEMVQNLSAKIDKLNDLRFWMDNMIFDKSSKE